MSYESFPRRKKTICEKFLDYFYGDSQSETRPSTPGGDLQGNEAGENWGDGRGEGETGSEFYESENDSYLQVDR